MLHLEKASGNNVWDILKEIPHNTASHREGQGQGRDRDQIESGNKLVLTRLFGV